MSEPKHRSRRDALASLTLAVAIAATTAATAAAQDLDVVTDGLSNPRGMAFGPDGRLYVSEAGRGGSGACVEAPEAGRACYGATGAVTRVDVRSGRKHPHVVARSAVSPRAVSRR